MARYGVRLTLGSRIPVRAEVLVVPRLNGQGTADGATEPGVGAADGPRIARGNGRRSGWCLQKQRAVRQMACTAGAKDGAADGAADAEDSAADGLHSRGQRYGAADGAVGAEDSAANGLHSEVKGWRSGRCCRG